MALYPVRKTDGDVSWFMHDRFGMFIHFGLYAMLARHEWVKSYERISDERYDAHFPLFNPDLFDAREWARQAKAAGMKYAVLTTKHHEGFCLFDSKFTEYKITNTPFGRDLVREYVDAFRAEGIKIGFYYSLLDWHHPDYIIDRTHPMRFCPEAPEWNEKRDMKKYTEYLHNQVRELLSNYGKIDVIFFDFSFQSTPGDRLENRGKGKEDWQSEKLIAMIRELQPGIIINNRLAVEGDIITPEQVVMKEWPRHPETGERVVWETCQTFSGAWGYHRDEASWKSPRMLIELLIRTVSFGGNLLMNVGPTARGVFDARAERALTAFGDFMKWNGRSIYGCTQAEPEFVAPRDCYLTESEDGKRLYIHMFSYPCQYLTMENLGGRIRYAQLLHDGSEIPYRVGVVQADLGATKAVEGAVTFTLPIVQPDDIVPVLEIFLK